MFRLLKLAAYGLLGYAIYEFVRGMMHGVERADIDRQPVSSQGHPGGRDAGNAGNATVPAAAAAERSIRPRQNMTGPGEGVAVATQEADGGTVPTASAAASSGRTR